MKFSVMQQGQENTVIEIVKEVFDEIIAPGYTQEGIDEFYNFANVENLAKRSKLDHFTILAQDNAETFGVIEIRETNHVSMFFVRKNYQNKGVGKSLFNEAMTQIKKRNSNIEELTVNSSLNAVPAYERLGFIIQNGEQCFNGISFVPMKLSLNQYAVNKAN